jgi:integrase
MTTDLEGATLFRGCNLKEKDVGFQNQEQEWNHELWILLSRSRNKTALSKNRTFSSDEVGCRASGDKAKQEIFDKRLGMEEKGTDLLSDFLDQVYLPWSKANKKSWRDDAYTAPMLKQYFEGKALREISAQLVEQFKNDRLNTKTKEGTARRPATVNRELTLLSSAFSLAVKYDKAESNPCSKVDLFTLDNLRYRYLLPEEEPKLMAQLNGPRAHLRPAVIVALGTGMRMGEQLQMKRHQADFLRNIVTARNTKNGRPRDIPMNDDVREALAELCRDKGPNDYIFVSPKNKKSCLQETKKGFHTACRLAGIEGLIWKDLRATFGTRLAEGGCDAFTIAQLLGHSDIRVTMRYVRTVEESKRAAVNAVQLNSRKNVQVLASWPKQPPVPAAVSR